ncbi:MAG: beta-galactosidase [Acutalibacteraceae bacterium]
MDEFRIGASYYPEWWSENEWEEDFSKMEALGFNAVRMGEFAWSWFEPKEGEYNFEPMLRVLDCAEKHGIKVIMGTTTAVCPPWLYKKYPEVKGGNEKGRYDFGGRKGQCLSSSVFLEYAERITEAQAKALGGHPAVIGWQLDNEPGFPFCDYDECCTKGFRAWLKEKYGTIDKLNKAWFTMMWSNVYNDFDEIDIPVNSSEGGWTKEIQLDYRKYFSFTFNRLLRMEAGIVRKYSPGRFIYTNWPGANWSVNCYEGSEYLDFAAWDNYVPQPNGDNYRVQLRASMEHSFDRYLSKGKHKFLVAEQTPVPDANTPAEVVRAQTWLNVSHGAFATLYFEWRSPTGGAEQGAESVLGRDKKYRENVGPVYRKLTAELKEHYPKFAESKTISPVAAVYSYENSWGTEGWVVDGPYDEEFFNAYGGFKNQLKTNVDVISIDEDLSRYKVIVMPDFRITTEEQAEKVKAYVRNGGIVVMNTECGTRDEYNRMRELLEPGLFADMCGAVAVENITAQKLENQTGEPGEVDFPYGKVHISGKIHRIKPSTAQCAATYTTGLLNCTPAVTVNSYGDGFAVLYGTDGNDVYFYETLAHLIKERFNIEPIIEADDGIIVSSRTAEDKEYIFAVNMKDKPVCVNLKEKIKDILTDKFLIGKTELCGYDVLVLEKDR